MVRGYSPTRIVFFGDDQNPFRDARLVQPGSIFCHFPSRTDWLQDGSFTDFNEENEDEERGMTRTIHIMNVVVLVGLLIGTVVVAGGGCVGCAFTMIVLLMLMMRVGEGGPGKVYSPHLKQLGSAVSGDISLQAPKTQPDSAQPVKTSGFAGVAVDDHHF